MSAGMVSALNAKEEDGGLHVQLVLEGDPEQADAMEKLRQSASRAVQAVGGVKRVTVVLAAHKAAPSMKSRKKEPAGQKLPEKVMRVIAVASGKGGVGKSTVAANLALALSAQGLKVGLMDVDVYGPSVPRLLGIAGMDVSTNEDGKLIPLKAHGLSVMSIGLLVDEDTPMIWRGPMVHGAIKQMFYDVAWDDLDLLVLDMPPGTGDAALSVAQQVPLSGVVIVSTPQDLALLDVRKGIGMFRKTGVPILGLVENMSRFECPHCGECTEIFGHNGAKEDAEELGVDFLGQIPLTMELRESADSGKPIMISNSESTPASVISKVAQRVSVLLGG